MEPVGTILLLDCQVIASLLGRIIYNLFFHPLASFPGPWLQASSTIPLMYATLIGHEHSVVVSMHKKYGPVVRIAPNKLSYITSKAWQDIYGHRNRAEPEMLKDSKWYVRNPNGPDIIYCSRAEHRRYRALFANGFSDRSLRSQESLINGYVTQLIDTLEQRVREDENAVFDMATWFGCVTFDIVGDLTFGESFDCLSSGGLHAWLHRLFESVKASVVLRVLQEVPLLGRYSTTIFPRLLRLGVLKSNREHLAFTEDKVRRRLSCKEPRADFLDPILRKPEGHGLSYSELLSSSSILITAGGETTMTGLSGILYLLLTHPEKMAVLAKEVRDAFQDESMVTIQSTSRLPYLGAVIEEGLRLYPPAPIGLPRTVPDGGFMIDGRFVPGGTSVRVSHLAAYRSATNFSRPDEFCPERFLNPAAFADDLAVFQPFSVGPRSCIGRNLAYAEMQLILARLLHHFDIRLEDPGFAFEMQRTFSTWEKPPLNVSLVPRRTACSMK
ncbi:cytochrome P450 [Aspergillus mulundensis]|uniref:Cytochrome P450 n=1 Tax=Aspergillus mulundensis TaxID=1810919 RepID=A0A3D8S5D3_9EURO|nr:hypothetical protein DSM5745_05074 [Aspergillus mulundensis]RDW81517.1 hypothetical protein DSM5745_05074 [Aspergillus mulundensis]